MSVEPGQLRVWDDAISIDKTPFLVLDQINKGWYYEPDWQILSNGKVERWAEGRLKRFSQVIDEAR